MDYRQDLKDKKKIVIKIGTSTITYPETGNINLDKLEKFVRILINLRNKGKEVIVRAAPLIVPASTIARKYSSCFTSIASLHTFFV